MSNEGALSVIITAAGLKCLHVFILHVGKRQNTCIDEHAFDLSVSVGRYCGIGSDAVVNKMFVN